MNKLEKSVAKLTKNIEGIRTMCELLSIAVPQSADGVGWTLDKNYKGNGYWRAFFADGAGNEETVIITEDDWVLIFAYDHEDVNNSYGSNLPLVQPVFAGLPAPLKEIILSGDLIWNWDEIEPKQVYATAAVWFNPISQKWIYNDKAYLDTDGGFFFNSGAWSFDFSNIFNVANWIFSYQGENPANRERLIAKLKNLGYNP